MRGVGEIGEAPPVAGEASRFRGSAPIGGHDSGRESAGTTVGNRRLLRKHNDLTRREGNTDCHVAPLLAMTVFLQEVRWAGRCRRSPLRDHFDFIYIGKFIFPGQKRNIYEYII